MTPGDRAVWLVPGRTGRIAAYNEAAQTVDMTFEDGSTRGSIPIAEVITVTEGDIALPSAVRAKPRPPSIPSTEQFGTPGLG